MKAFPLGLVFGLAASMLASCDRSTNSGTMDDTNTAVAKLYGPDAEIVANADVYAFRRSDSGRAPVARGTTRVDGSFQLPVLPDGLYRLVSRKDSLVSAMDSVYVVSGNPDLHSDTLGRPRSVTGVIRMVGDDNPASVFVTVLGSDFKANVDSRGVFRLNGLAKGSWTLVCSTPEPGYQSTVVDIRVESGATVLDTIDMVWYGIGPVENLTASTDAMAGTVDLAWTLPDGLRGVRDVQVQRVLKLSTNAPAVVGSSDSGRLIDRLSPEREETVWLYTLQIRMNDGRQGRISYVTVRMGPRNLGAPSLRIDSWGFEVPIGQRFHFSLTAQVGTTPLRSIAWSLGADSGVIVGPGLVLSDSVDIVFSTLGAKALRVSATDTSGKVWILARDTVIAKAIARLDTAWIDSSWQDTTRLVDSSRIDSLRCETFGGDSVRVGDSIQVTTYSRCGSVLDSSVQRVPSTPSADSSACRILSSDSTVSGDSLVLVTRVMCNGTIDSTWRTYPLLKASSAATISASGTARLAEWRPALNTEKPVDPLIPQTSPAHDATRPSALSIPRGEC